MTTTTRRVLPLLATLALILAACGPQTAPASAPAASGAAQPAPAVTPAAAPGAGAQAATAAPPQPPIQLKVGTQRLSSDAPLYAADERGYFTEQGLDVEFVEIGAGAASIPSLAAGQFDVGVGSINPALYNAIARGIDIKLVATKGSTPPVAEGSLIGSQALVLAADVAASGAIQDYADLRGKSVALPDRGSTLERALHKALERGGLTIEDVEIKLLAYADMLPALSNRSVDAAMELEPFIAQGAARGILVPWKRGTELYPGQQATAVIFGPTMAQIGGNAG